MEAFRVFLTSTASIKEFPMTPSMEIMGTTRLYIIIPQLVGSLAQTFDSLVTSISVSTALSLGHSSLHRKIKKGGIRHYVDPELWYRERWMYLSFHCETKVWFHQEMTTMFFQCSLSGLKVCYKSSKKQFKKPQAINFNPNRVTSMTSTDSNWFQFAFKW